MLTGNPMGIGLEFVQVWLLLSFHGFLIFFWQGVLDLICMEGSKDKVMASWLLCLSAKFAFGPELFGCTAPPGGGCLGQSGHSPDGKHSLPTSNGELSFPDSSPHALSDVCGQGGSLGATAEFYYEFQSTFSSISVGKQLKDLSCDFVILSIQILISHHPISVE